MKTERRPLSTPGTIPIKIRLPGIPHTSAEGAGLPGGQPQNYPPKDREEVLGCQRGRWGGEQLYGFRRNRLSGSGQGRPLCPCLKCSFIPPGPLSTVSLPKSFVILLWRCSRQSNSPQ